MEEEEEKITTHESIKCDSCYAEPIEGIRYKCSICCDYDICQKCEESTHHEHALIKIKHSNQPY